MDDVMQNLPEPNTPRQAAGGTSALTIVLVVVGVLGVGFLGLCAGIYFLILQTTAGMEDVFVEVAAELNESEAMMELSQIEIALSLYKLDLEDFPTTAQGLEAVLEAPDDLDDPDLWRGPYLENADLQDAWGNPYQYRSPGEWNPEAFDLWSMGPDGIDDTDDDIHN